jgi:hypothetical protein
MVKAEKIKYFLVILILGFGLAVFYHYILNRYYGLGYPLNTFLFLPSDHFNDFYNVVIKGTGETVYFPLARLVIYPFELFKSHVFAMMVFMLLTFIPIVYYNWVNLKGDKLTESIMNTFVFTFLSYPLLYLIDRANFESFVYLSLCCFIVLFKNGKTFLSTIPLAFAISLKLFPAVFIILFVADKKYKEVVITGAFIAIFTIMALLILPGSMLENITALFANQHKFNTDYAIGFDGFDFGISLFGVIKGAFVFLKLGNYVQSIFLLYVLFSFLIFLFLSWYIIVVEKEFWKRVTLLVIAMCILPHVSFAYKSIHLLIPIFLFINAAQDDNNRTLNILLFKFKFVWLYTLLFALLLIPKNYRLFVGVYDGVFVDTFVMMLISFLIIFTGLSKYHITFVVSSKMPKKRGMIYISD